MDHQREQEQICYPGGFLSREGTGSLQCYVGLEETGNTFFVCFFVDTIPVIHITEWGGSHRTHSGANRYDRHALKMLLTQPENKQRKQAEGTYLGEAGSNLELRTGLPALPSQHLNHVQKSCSDILTCIYLPTLGTDYGHRLFWEH